MADVEYDLYEDPAVDDAPGRLAETGRMVVNWFGALLSVGLLGGLSVWGYELTQREVGNVPVLRALEGPMRVIPEDPGGLAAAHQGLAVTEVPARGGVAAPPVAVALAPAPAALDAADRPQPRLREAALAAPQPAPDATPIAAPAVLELPPGQPVNVADLIRLAEAEARQGGGAGAIRAIPASLPGVALSPRPEPRPRQGDPVSRAQGAGLDGPLARAADVAAASLPAGTVVAQLGAYDTPEQVETAWQDILAAHGSFLDGRQRLIQRAGGGTHALWRLRLAGFADRDEARRFCAAMRNRGAECVPTTLN